MTSLEALKRIKEKLGRDATGYCDDFLVVLKDLEVLIILKNMLAIVDKSNCPDPYLGIKYPFFDSPEEVKQVKEWLER